MKIGRGELFLQRPGADAFDALPIGKAQGLEINGKWSPDNWIAALGNAAHLYGKALRKAHQTITITFTGLEYNLENLLKLGYINVVYYRQWRAVERQRVGKKVFYPRRRQRSMKGK